MTTTVVRYQARLERADERGPHLRRLRRVAQSPASRFPLHRLPAGDSTFVHVDGTDDGTDDAALTSLPAFSRFAADILERRHRHPTGATGRPHRRLRTTPARR